MEAQEIIARRIAKELSEGMECMCSSSPRTD
jgi:hypothetical protein